MLDLDVLVLVESTKPGHEGLGVVWWALLRALRDAWDVGDMEEVEALMGQVMEVVPPVPLDYDPYRFLEASRFTPARDGRHQYQLIERVPAEAGGWRAQLLFLEHLRDSGRIEIFPPNRAGLPYRYRTFTTSDGTFRYWPLVEPAWHILNRRVAPEEPSKPPTLFEEGE